jgi:hypothetical protein
MRQDLLLETMWEEASEEEFSTLWSAEVDDLRGKPAPAPSIWWRPAPACLGPSGRPCPGLAYHHRRWPVVPRTSGACAGRPKLAAAFGIEAAIVVSGEDTAKHVLGTGEMATLGSYRLKRSLVAGEHRLELLDWPYSRLGELKAAGCFTEIIQHKTRLFIPVRAASA